MEARRRRKEKMNAKIEKKTRKLMKKRIKEEKEKHPFFGHASSSSKLRATTVFLFSISIHPLGMSSVL